MKRKSCLNGSFIFFLLIVMSFAGIAEAQVRVYTKTLNLTTYGWGVDDNPRLSFNLPVKTLDIECYPYAAHDVITGKKENIKYHAVILENEYIRLILLPEVGGRIQGATDKVNGWNFLQYNHVIKPTLTSTLIGAWQSGGLEWNFPGGHRASGLDRVNYRIIENTDGSKTVYVGEIEPRYRMQWVVGVTVFPNKSYFKIDAKFINATPFKHQFGAWFNAAVYATPETQVIFPPTAWSATHGIRAIWDWPVIDGVDYSFIKNAQHSVSFFSMNDRQDFFGCYHHDKGTGSVHIADHYTVPGKKFFYWGNDQRSHVYELNQTDNDGNYVELQSGAYVYNQGYGHAWLDPFETKTLVEYWYPIRDIGGFKYANRDAAINLDSTKNGNIAIGILATGVFTNSEIKLAAHSKTIYNKTISLSPQKAFVDTIKKPENIAYSDLVLTLLDSNQHPIATYAAGIKRGEAPENLIRPKPAESLSIEELLINAENAQHTLKAENLLKKVLSIDPGNARAHQLLGEMYVDWAMYPKAIEHLQESLTRDPFNNSAETFYYLGLAELGQGNTIEAEEALWRATYRVGFRSPAYLALGEIALARGAYDRAIELLQSALEANAENLRAKGLLITANRLRGKTKKARAIAAEILNFDPIHPLALWENYRLAQELNDTLSARLALEEFNHCVGYTDAYYLDVANIYRSASLFGEAILVLEQAEKHLAATSPISIYTLGYCLLKSGKADAAQKYFEEASQKSPVGVFAYRRETIPVLKQVLQINPQDAHACYYLGDLLYFKKQDQKAINLWEKSEKLIPEFPTVHRNLANAYWAFDGNIGKAIEEITQAQKLAPNDPRIYVELERMYLAGGDLKKCLSILEKNQKIVNIREDAPKYQAAIYVILGEYDKALRLIRSRRWHSWEWEGDIGNHTIYSIAYIERGKKYLEQNKYRKALRDFQKSLEWPLFLGVGSLPEYSYNMMNYYIGLCYEGMGKTKKAREVFTRAADQKMQEVSIAVYYRGLALKKLGRNAEAQKLFQLLAKTADEWIEKKHDLPVAYILKSASLKAFGDPQQAGAYRHKALEMDKLAELRAIGQSWGRIQKVAPPPMF